MRALTVTLTAARALYLLPLVLLVLLVRSCLRTRAWRLALREPTPILASTAVWLVMRLARLALVLLPLTV